MTNEIGIHKILLMTNCPYLGFRLGMKTDRRMDGRKKTEDTQYQTLKFKHEIYITILFHCKIKIKQLAGKSGEHREKRTWNYFVSKRKRVKHDLLVAQRRHTVRQSDTTIPKYSIADCLSVRLHVFVFNNLLKEIETILFKGNSFK